MPHTADTMRCRNRIGDSPITITISTIPWTRDIPAQFRPYINMGVIDARTSGSQGELRDDVPVTREESAVSSSSWRGCGGTGCGGGNPGPIHHAGAQARRGAPGHALTVGRSSGDRGRAGEIAGVYADGSACPKIPQASRTSRLTRRERAAGDCKMVALKTGSRSRSCFARRRGLDDVPGRRSREIAAFAFHALASGSAEIA